MHFYLELKELKCYTVNKKPPHEKYRAEVFIVSLMSERLLLDLLEVGILNVVIGLGTFLLLVAALESCIGTGLGTCL